MPAKRSHHRKSAGPRESGYYGDHRLPVDDLAIEYDMPMEVARCFIGRTPAATEENINNLRAYMDTLSRSIQQHYREEGFPLTPMGVA